MELHKKVIGNAVSSYFLIGVCIAFLWSKNSYVSHPFVKSHVKVAFSLHILLLFMLFIMSFGIFDSISISGFSVNTLIVMVLGLGIIAGIMFGAYKAHLGQTITLGEMFQNAGVQKNLIQKNTIGQISEETQSLLILAHIPFLGYIISGRHPEITHIKDITFINFIATCIAVIFSIFGFYSLASITMLGYVIWSVFQIIQLISQHELTTLNPHFVLSPEKKYILQKSLFTYIIHTLKKDSFIPLHEIIARKTLLRKEDEEKNTQINIQKLASPITPFIYYIPFINIIALIFLKKQELFHMIHGLILTLITLVLIILFGWNSYILLLVLFPIFFGIGYTHRLGYKMPYIYDIYAIFSGIFIMIKNIFHTTRKLQKTVIQESIKIGDTNFAPLGEEGKIKEENQKK